jgi:hypothetical protein
MRVNVNAGLAVMVLTNGVADTADVQRYALGLVRAGRDGTEPPETPPLPEVVPDAARFAGNAVHVPWSEVESVTSPRFLFKDLDHSLRVAVFSKCQVHFPFGGGVVSPGGEPDGPSISRTRSELTSSPAG